MGKELVGRLELNQIYQLDCIEGMKLIPDSSIDLIIIDPPYNIGIDKDWDSFSSVEAYVDFMNKVFEQCDRVLSFNGSFYWFHNDMSQVPYLFSAIQENTDLEFKSFITINKSDNNYIKDLYGSQNHFRRFLNIAEYCLFYTKGNRMASFDTGWERTKTQSTFKRITNILQNDIALSGINEEYIYELAYQEGRYKSKTSAKVNIRYKLGLSKGHRFDFIDEKMYEYLGEFIRWSLTYSELKKEYDLIVADLQNEIEEKEKLRYTFNAKEGVNNVWTYSFRTDKKTIHPTQKPVKLIEDIIRYSSNTGDLVLDCFMGSGTTAVAAKKSGRNFIGFEREGKYIAIINSRLDAVQNTEVNDTQTSES